uniref:C2H2-type domain-containing protein n=1 Tax=Caenorhabditis tropicalis TaxID=1561998 RepID=A0A1I7UU22_9PELO
MINVPYFSTGHVVRRLFEILRQMGFESEDVQFDNVGLPYNEPFAARALGIVFMEILNLIKNEYLGDGTESAENLGLLYAMDRTNQTSRITYVIINGRQKQKCRVCGKSYELKNYGAHLGTKTHIINMIVFIFPNYNVRS